MDKKVGNEINQILEDSFEKLQIYLRINHESDSVEQLSIYLQDRHKLTKDDLSTVELRTISSILLQFVQNDAHQQKTLNLIYDKSHKTKYVEQLINYVQKVTMENVSKCYKVINILKTLCLVQAKKYESVTCILKHIGDFNGLIIE